MGSKNKLTNKLKRMEEEEIRKKMMRKMCEMESEKLQRNDLLFLDTNWRRKLNKFL